MLRFSDVVTVFFCLILLTLVTFLTFRKQFVTSTKLSYVDSG